MASTSYYTTLAYAAPSAPDYLVSNMQQHQQPHTPTQNGCNTPFQYQQLYQASSPVTQFASPAPVTGLSNGQHPAYHGASPQPYPPPSHCAALPPSAPTAPPYGSQYSAPSSSTQQYRSSFTSHTADSRPNRKLEYVLNQIGETKGLFRNKFRPSATWEIRLVDAPTTSPPEYTITLCGTSKLHKDADLILSRGLHGPEVGRVDWQKDIGYENITPRFPFMSWPAP